jgi:hypothetical protein
VRAASDRKATAPKVRRLLTIWGRTEIRVGRLLAALKAPTAAARGNRDLARARQLLGARALTLAGTLPASRSGIARTASLLRKPSIAAPLLRATRELRAAGFGL